MVTTTLRERVRRTIRIHNMSPRTERIYIDAIFQFAVHFNRSPDLLGAAEVEAYLYHLRDVKKVSWCRFNQAASALRFFYAVVLLRTEMIPRIPYGRSERHLPVVLSIEELLALLAAIDNLRDQVLLTLLYSAGLRLGEVCRLCVSDIDSSRMLIRVRQGKGKKDRYAPLSTIVLELLREWWRKTRPTDLFFPNLKDPSRHINVSSVQRAVKVAAKRAGITKSISPRTLRHCFATHLMEQGIPTRVIQVLLGHANIRTTETYTHVTPAHARSPLDGLMPKGEPPSRA